MKILHTEASPGWGGQEMRILREAEGMRSRGHEVIFAIREAGGLVKPARDAGFLVYEIPFTKKTLFSTFFQLLKIIRKQAIDLVNTHSSFDAWIGGLAAKLSGSRVIRTRHLSTPIRTGWNSRILYNWLADAVVTTCASVEKRIQIQAKLSHLRCRSIPTGIDPKALIIDPKKVRDFRAALGAKPSDFLVGTLCVLRGWKGVSDLLRSAKLLENVPGLKWVVIGGGVSEAHFKNEWRTLGLEKKVIFTGALYPPYTALAALDLFLLLSRAHEGVSQATLQAAWLEKPLITTPVGGLKEVCLHGKTGLQVNIEAPHEVADAVKCLMRAPELCKEMGKAAHRLVEENFTLEKTLDGMEEMYRVVFGN